MPAGSRATLYAHLCFRLALQRERSSLELLGLAGVQTRDRNPGGSSDPSLVRTIRFSWVSGLLCRGSGRNL